MNMDNTGSEQPGKKMLYAHYPSSSNCGMLRREGNQEAKWKTKAKTIQNFSAS